MAGLLTVDGQGARVLQVGGRAGLAEEELRQQLVLGPTRKPGAVVLLLELEAQPALASIPVWLVHLARQLPLDGLAILEPG